MAIWFSSIWRSRTIRIAQALAVGTATILAAGCSEQGSADQTAANAPVSIQTSQLFMTVQTNTGVPLLALTVAIVPFGTSPEYTKFFGRLENSEKRDVALSEFRGRDSTPFSLRLVRPKAVHIRATDVNGKPYDCQRPWQ